MSVICNILIAILSSYQLSKYRALYACLNCDNELHAVFDNPIIEIVITSLAAGYLIHHIVMLNCKD